LILVTRDKRDVAFAVDMASKWPSLVWSWLCMDITSNRVQLISLFMAMCSPQTLVRALRYSNVQALSLYLLKELWWIALLYCITFTKLEHKMAKSRDWQRVWSQLPYALGSNCVSLNDIVLRSRSTLLLVPIS
jgi:hypothetical protein